MSEPMTTEIERLEKELQKLLDKLAEEKRKQVANRDPMMRFRLTVTVTPYLFQCWEGALHSWQLPREDTVRTAIDINMGNDGFRIEEIKEVD